jgi:hypothetical protein
MPRPSPAAMPASATSQRKVRSLSRFRPYIYEHMPRARCVVALRQDPIAARVAGNLAVASSRVGRQNVHGVRVAPISSSCEFLYSLRNDLKLAVLLSVHGNRICDLDSCHLLSY